MRYMILLCACSVAICSAAQEITAITYNVRYLNGHDGKNRWDVRKEAVAAAVLKEQPHVVGLQEVLREQLAFLNEQWPMYHHYGVGRDDGRDGGEYAPIYWDTTRFSQLDARTIWLSPTPHQPSKGWDASNNRIVTVVVLHDLSTGDSLWVANSHWDYMGRIAREESAHIIAGLLAAPVARGKRVLFMGDLNAAPKEVSISTMRGLLTDSCPKAPRGKGTFNGFKCLRIGGRRIDYMWLAPERFDVLEYRVPKPKVNGRQASDHFPVIVRLMPR